MQINLKLNGKTIKEEIADDLLLIDFVRKHGCYSVKRGCETANCGLCTVFLNGKPVLSCSVLTARANGQEGDHAGRSQPEAEEIGSFLAGQGAEQCGFCNPGFMMNAIALFRKIRTRPMRRSSSICPETSAAVPVTRASSGR